MKKLILLALLAMASTSYGDTVFGDGILTTTDPTFVNPGGSTTGSAIHYYDVVQFTVSANGAYTFNLASINSGGGGAGQSNALDTFIRIYANVFNPAAPGAGISSNDDFTGAFTVLPGPYAGIGLTANSTGFTGAQPGSRVLNLNLLAGVQYFFVITSFRETNYVTVGTEARPVGTYYFGATGPGIIAIVPEPGTAALLVVAAGGLGLMAWRRRKAA